MLVYANEPLAVTGCLQFNRGVTLLMDGVGRRHMLKVCIGGLCAALLLTTAANFAIHSDMRERKVCGLQLSLTCAAAATTLLK